MSAQTRQAMWELFDKHFERTDRDTFLADLATMRHVILFHAPDGTLQGFTALRVTRHGTGRRRPVVLFPGETLITPRYQGQTAPHYAALRYLMATKLRHPAAPVYWFLDSQSLKSYLLLSRNFPEHWPRHDRPTPPEVQELIDGLGRHYYGDGYLPELGVARRDPPVRVAGWVAPLDPREADRPDVRFYLARNPGWTEGDLFCCLGRVDLAQGVHFLRRIAARSLGRRPPPGNGPVTRPAAPSTVAAG